MTYLIPATLKAISIATLFVLSSVSVSAHAKTIIDDFSDKQNTLFGTPRMSLTDVSAGGKTSANTLVENGVIKVTGDIFPARGQPGWSSLVLPLAAQGQMHDASQHSGIKLMVKVNQGSLSLSANSAEVTNFDYHAAQVFVKADGQFHEVNIPFNSMKRMWSKQTPLKPQTLNSLSIVAYSLQKASYDFELRNVSFY